MPSQSKLFFSLGCFVAVQFHLGQVHSFVPPSWHARRAPWSTVLFGKDSEDVDLDKPPNGESGALSADDGQPPAATVTESVEERPKPPPRTTLMGGDHAGIWVDLDLDGKVIPVPSHMVPESMKEWGQEPEIWEILTSEDNIIEDAIYNRHTIKILPETGCSVDNMETSKSEMMLQEITGFLFHDADDQDKEVGCVQCYASQTLIKPLTNAVEVPKDDQWLVDVTFDCNSNGLTDHRVRLGMWFKRLAQPKEDSKHLWELSDKPPAPYASPLHVVFERQFATNSSSGTLADGGGLDGKRVSGWIGDDISKVSSSFAAPKVPKKEKSDDAFTTIELPFNLTLSYGYVPNEDYVNEDDFVVQVGHHRWDNDEQVDKDDSSYRWVKWLLSDGYTEPADALVSFGTGKTSSDVNQ